MALGAQLSGSSFLTSDSNLTSGNPARVFAVHEIYGASSVGSVLRNGIDATGDAYIMLNETDSTGVTTDFGSDGFLFPNGLFYDKGTNVTSILIEFRVEI